jgi:hypothetical protein
VWVAACPKTLNWILAQSSHMTYLDLWHLCGGKFMENLQEPIDHTKLLGKWGYSVSTFFL